jgi:hypothetical protein
MMLSVEFTPSEAGSYRPFIEALLDPDTPLRPMARLLLAGTLSSNRPELQGLAVDAVVVAVVGEDRLAGPRDPRARNDKREIEPRRRTRPRSLVTRRARRAMGGESRLTSAPRHS